MSQGQEEFEQDELKQRKPKDFLSLLVSILVLVTICMCTVLLVLIVNLRNEIKTLREDIYAWQSEDITAVEESLPDSEVADGYNEMEDEEASDIAEAAELENVVWEEDTDKSSNIRRVYLTFDDGPSSNTDKILDILAEYEVKATFFVVGKEGYNSQYKRIVEEGHTLGMHSYSHVYGEIYQSVEAYSQDLMKLHDYLYELTGVDSEIVRFPGGSSNTISHVDMRDLIAYLDEEDMVYFDWNVSSGDAAGGYISAEQIADNVLKNVNSYNNAVVLFHDAAGKSTTVEALPIIIEKILESEDTVLLPITEDTVPVQHLH